MDFAAWSPSHLIIAAITIGTIIAHMTYRFSRLQSAIERLCERQDNTNQQLQSIDKRMADGFQQIDKRLDDVHRRIDDTNQQVGKITDHLLNRRDDS